MGIQPWLHRAAEAVVADTPWARVKAAAVHQLTAGALWREFQFGWRKAPCSAEQAAPLYQRPTPRRAAQPTRQRATICMEGEGTW
jgi:hypothetical protein